MPRPLQRIHADELTTLCETLDRGRAGMLRRLSDLTAEQLARSVAVLRPEGETCSLRWVLLHMIEETARHLGHADLIRESVDGDTSRTD